MAKTDLYHKIEIEDILKDFEKYPRKGKFKWWNLSGGGNNPYQGANSKLLTVFEEKVGLELPPDYKEFLKFSNGANLWDFDIWPIDNIEHSPFLYEDDAGHVRTKSNVYVIGANAVRESLLIDLEKPRGAKNPNRRNILNQDHNLDSILTVIAKSFGEFLYRFNEGGKMKDKEGDDNDKSLYWIQKDFKLYKEYAGVEFDDL